MISGRQGILIMMLIALIVSLLSLNVSAVLGWFVAIVLFLLNWKGNGKKKD